jgi:hypothetical protein
MGIWAVTQYRVAQQSERHKMKEAKTKKTEKQAPAPTLANLFGFSMTAVMRRLGKASKPP